MARHTRNIEEPLPVSGGWKETDPVAFRKFKHIGPLRLENDQVIPDVTMSFETFGELNADRSNAVLILHALTGDAHVTGDVAPGQKTAGWFSEIVGPGKVIDTDRYFVLAPNILGGCHGSTGPRRIKMENRGVTLPGRVDARSGERGDSIGGCARSTDFTWYWRFPRWAARDQWGIAAADRVKIWPSSHRSDDHGGSVAWAHTQINAVTLDEHWHGGDYYAARSGRPGLSLARQIVTCASGEDEEHFDQFHRGRRIR